jgi:predicted RNA-binding Zn-ribbon protein involved in translation (DUF1610 family)
MEESIQFRFNIQKETSTQQEISGSQVLFRLRVFDETQPMNHVDSTSTSVKLQEHIKAKWDWVTDRCIICYGQIKSDSAEVIWKCPHCGKVAHFDHVESWLQQKQKCPVCRQSVYL